jgi:hypothetical protein
MERDWTLAATVSWAHTASLQTGPLTSPAPAAGSSGGSLILPSQSTVNAEYGGLQLTRIMGRHMSAYLSYTAQYQSIAYPGPSTQGTNGAPLVGLGNIIGFGFSYTSGDRRIRRQ